MTFSELKEYNQNRKLIQVSFMVHDIKKAMDKWIDRLKVGPFMVFDLSNDYVYDTESINGAVDLGNFKVKVAVASMGAVQIELIQPICGMPIYQDFLDNYGEGIHHIKEGYTTTEEFYAGLEEFKNDGFPVLFAGGLNATRFAYLDTIPEFNFIYELGDMVAGDRSIKNWYLYPAPEPDA